MKIEVGCGTKPTKPGFLTNDIRDVPGVDFVCTAWELDRHVDHYTVEHIFSRHFFEHLTFEQGEYVMSMWYKLLKPNAICEMIVPNITFHIDQWINRRTDKELQQAKAGLWGWQNDQFEDTWPVHKSGYDSETLVQLYTKHGYTKVKSLEPVSSRHLHVIGYKP
jgi:predicted SAM-dependent methyltransferase